jgi:hypothetical protein
MFGGHSLWWLLDRAGGDAGMAGAPAGDSLAATARGRRHGGRVDIEVAEGDPGELGHDATAAEIDLAAQTRHHRRCMPPPAPVVCGILYPLVLDSVRAV